MLLPTWYVVLNAVVFGAVIGSFLNVVVYRVPAGKSLMGSSVCPRCGHGIRPWHNVPVLGWLWLRGRCADCAEPISWRYPAVEALTAVLFGVATAANGVNWFLPALLYFAAISVALALIDLDTLTLPDVIVKPSWIVMALLLALAAWGQGSWEDAKRAAMAAAVVGGGYLLLWLVTLGLGLGFGDVKLAPILGAVMGFLSWDAVIVGTAAAWFLGGVLGVVGLLTGYLKRGRKIPFGPFLIVGAWIGLLAGPWLWGQYLSAVGLA